MQFSGLSAQDVERARAKHGENVLERREQLSPLKVLLSQFFSPLIYILLVAGGMSLFLDEVLDAVIIFAAVGINTFLGFFQEFKAQSALQELSKVLNPQAKVWRSSKLVTIAVEELVVGDVVFIEAGDQVPADGGLIDAKDLRVNEALLTGESLPIHKHSHEPELVLDHLPSPQEEEADHCLYMGTTCLQGTGVLKILAVGSQTQVGKIAKELSSNTEPLTPLQLRIKRLGQLIAAVVLLIAVLIVIIGLWRDKPLVQMVTLGAAVAVSAIPEGLLISLTVILSFGMQRILKKKALVRRLVAAETLGSITTICTDKTGTLTEGKLALFRAHGQDQSQLKAVGKLLTSPTDILEVVIAQWAEKSRVATPTLIDEVPFSSERKFSLKMSDEQLWMVGAPEVIASYLGDVKETQTVEAEMSVYAKQGYRLVAVASRPTKKGEQKIDLKKIGHFEFVGFYIFSDPVRPDVKKAFQQIQKAGVKVKVITGDHSLTAQAVMNELGMQVKANEVMLGKELMTLDASQIAERLPRIKLFARTTPDQKLSIVKMLQAMGEVVAMTGDGVNDAPALKQADIGIVVSGATDVSKSTADMVLLDDNFRTIVTSVEEGRGIYESVRKVVLYLMANSFSETILVLGSLLFALPLPITAVQVLWINLATDSLPSIALTLEPKDKNLLKQPPRPREGHLIDGELRVLMAVISLFTGIGGLLLFWWLLPAYDHHHLQTLIFSLIAVLSLLYTFSCRSLHKPFWQVPLKQNWWVLGAVGFGFLMQLLVVYHPFLQKLFETTALNWRDWGVILLASAMLLSLVEGVKWWYVTHLSK